ncbi:MAG: DUF3820 family protein [Crocinitomicaceae bacterium]
MSFSHPQDDGLGSFIFSLSSFLFHLSSPYRIKRNKNPDTNTEIITFTPMDQQAQRKHLIDLVSTPMPFGKYKGTYICDLPEFYLVWYRNKGFPAGKIGVLMASIYEIKLNGLEYILKPIKDGVRKNKY